MGASVGSAAVSDPFAADAGGLPTGQDLEVDLGAFLPPDVVLGEPAHADDAEADAPEATPAPAEPEPSAGEGQGPDLAALEQIEADLAGVDRALAALDAGTYGHCTACGEAIADELLAADPTRATCVTHG